MSGPDLCKHGNDGGKPCAACDSSPAKGLPPHPLVTLVAFNALSDFHDARRSKLEFSVDDVRPVVVRILEAYDAVLADRRAQEEPGSAPPPEPTPEFINLCVTDLRAIAKNPYLPPSERARHQRSLALVEALLARAVPRGEPRPSATALAERFLADKTVWPLGCNLVAQRVTRGFAVWLDAQAVDRLPAGPPDAPALEELWTRLGDTRSTAPMEVTMDGVNYSAIVQIVDKMRKQALALPQQETEGTDQ